MTQIGQCFTVSGTPLERAGDSPLMAVALYAGDGALAYASVVDPAQGPFRSGPDTVSLSDGVAWVNVPYDGDGGEL
jgi:hypothetical protein